jgi:hypothetical protein
MFEPAHKYALDVLEQLQHFHADVVARAIARYQAQDAAVHELAALAGIHGSEQHDVAACA